MFIFTVGTGVRRSLWLAQLSQVENRSGRSCQYLSIARYLAFFGIDFSQRRPVEFTLCHHKQTVCHRCAATNPILTPSSPPPGHGLPLGLAQARRLSDLLRPALALHTLSAEPAHVAGALGVARLGVLLLAAEPELGVLLGPLVVRGPAALVGPAPLARLVELVVDADVEEVRLVGVEVAAVLGALCLVWYTQVSLLSRSCLLLGMLCACLT